MMFTLVLGVIFYDLFNMAGFSYIDEICALLLFILFGINVLRSKNWAFDKIFLLIYVPCTPSFSGLFITL